MPLYTYRWTDDAGGEFEEFQHIREPALTERDGRPCERTVQMPNVRTEYGAGSNTKPVELHSIALLNDRDIAEFRRRNPGTDISSDRRSPLYGVPVVKSRSEKLRVLDREGFVETK